MLMFCDMTLDGKDRTVTVYRDFPLDALAEQALHVICEAHGLTLCFRDVEPTNEEDHQSWPSKA